MKKRINGFLQKYFGIKLIHSGLGFFKKYSIYKTRPIYVEFYGPSGVGKTTLFRSAKKSNKNRWLPLQNFKEIYLSRLKRNTLIPDSIYQFLAEDKIEEVLENPMYPMSSVKMDKIRFFYSTLIDDLLIKSFNKNYTIVSEEGLIQIYTSSIMKLCCREESDFREFLKDRAVIYCYAPAEVIANQIIKRNKNEKNLRIEHATDSFNELVEKQFLELENKNKLIRKLKELTVPVLLVDTTIEIKENVKRINEFIQDLQKNNI